MKKRLLAALLACTMVVALASGCGKESAAKKASKELKDGKFVETKQITVEIYDRGNDGGTDPENNMYTDYIKKGMLEKYNVEVTFKKVPRWTETDDINNLLAAQEAPDICVTYSYPTVQTYADMGGVIDLNEWVNGDTKDLLPNLWAFLGDTNINWNKDPKTGSVWAIEGKRVETQRCVTFIRKDWLDKLGLSEPKTTAEFEACIKAFKDNASLLLGKDADKMIPFSISYDAGWRASNLIESFVDPKMTEKDMYIVGFDDRKATYPNTKEAVRLLNKWYNAGYIWKDFALYGAGDTTEDNYLKVGYVGAFIHNWDYPFRGGDDSINCNLQREVGPDAKFIAIDPFQNSDGKTVKWMNSSAGDRKIFFPTTNDEPLASMLYLDFISSPEVIAYLQMGDEGVTHKKLEGGAIEILPATGAPVQNSGKNIDYTITCNGTYYGDIALGTKSLAYGYAKIDPADVTKASDVANANGFVPKNVNVGAIKAEAGVGDTLTSKRDQLFDNAIVAPEKDFDKVWDSYMSDYLKSGGQAIQDERKAKWEEFFGNKTSIN